MTKELKVDNLTFDRGDSTFTATEFVNRVKPYFKDLDRVGRTNFLFVAEYGDGSKPDVTGYATGTTINATINSRVTKCERTNGRWAVYQLK
jgi:hypothetical protein